MVIDKWPGNNSMELMLGVSRLQRIRGGTRMNKKLLRSTIVAVISWILPDIEKANK